MFLSAVNKSIDNIIKIIEKITDNSKFEILRLDIFVNLVSTIHFIADYEERIREKEENEDKEFFKAFLYVNNQLKHDVNLEFVYYSVAGSMYPRFYPMRYGKPGICWKDFPDNGRETARAKREHYNKCLLNKDVVETLKQVKQIINKY